MTNKPLKVTFAPGCFDHFEGTQDELNALVAELHDMFDGKTEDDLKEICVPIDDDFIDQLDDDDREEILNMLEKSNNGKRLLN